MRRGSQEYTYLKRIRARFPLSRVLTMHECKKINKHLVTNPMLLEITLHFRLLLLQVEWSISKWQAHDLENAIFRFLLKALLQLTYPTTTFFLYDTFCNHFWCMCQNYLVTLVYEHTSILYFFILFGWKVVVFTYVPIIN